MSHKAPSTAAAPGAAAAANNGNVGGGTRPFHTKPSPWRPLRVSLSSAAAAIQKKRLLNASHSSSSHSRDPGGDSATTGMPESNHSSLSSINEQVNPLPGVGVSGTSGPSANNPQAQRTGPGTSSIINSAVTALHNALNNSAPQMDLQPSGTNSRAAERTRRRSSISHPLVGGTDAAMGRPRRASGIVGRRRSSMAASTGSQSSNPYIPRGDSGGGGEGALASSLTRTRLLRRRSSGDYSDGSGDEIAASGGSGGISRRPTRRRSRRISQSNSRTETSKQRSQYQRRMSANNVSTDNVSTAAVYHGLKGPDVESELGLQLQMVDAKQSRRHAQQRSSAPPPRRTEATRRRNSLDLALLAQELAEAESIGSEEEEGTRNNANVSRRSATTFSSTAAVTAGRRYAPSKGTVKGEAQKRIRKKSDADDSAGNLSTITPISSGSEEESSSVSLPKSRSTDSFDDRGDDLAKRFEQSLDLQHRLADGTARKIEDEEHDDDDDDDDSIDLDDIPSPPSIAAESQSQSRSQSRSDTILSSNPGYAALPTRSRSNLLSNVTSAPKPMGSNSPPRQRVSELHNRMKLRLEKKEEQKAVGPTADHEDAFDTVTIVSQADTVLASNVNKNSTRPAQGRPEGTSGLPMQISTAKKKPTTSHISGRRSQHYHQNQLLSGSTTDATKLTKLRTSESLDASAALTRSSRHGRRSKSAERRTLRSGSSSHAKGEAQTGHAHALWAAPMKRRGSGNNAA